MKRAGIAGDRSSVSVRVEVAPAVAFDVFTKEIDLWWGKGPAYRIGGKQPGTLAFEPGVGGRLLETYGDGTKIFVAGTITVWEPPSRLSFEWRSITFTPDQKTFVDVTFEPSGDATLVTVVHHGWAAIPDDHRVRHGATGAAFVANIGRWWGSLMSSLREHAAGDRG